MKVVDRMISLGTLTEITDLRQAWPHEAHDFTPWLAKNIAALGDTIGIDLSIEETESSVGDFSVDIYAYDADTGRKIIIENQLECKGGADIFLDQLLPNNVGKLF